jgi:ankyrin repeat protein
MNETQELSLDTQPTKASDATLLTQFLDSVLELNGLSVQTKHDIIKVINCLIFIKHNPALIAYAVENRKNEEIYTSKKDMKNRVIRDDHNTAIHIGAFRNSEEAVQQLNNLIEQFEKAILLMKEKDKLSEFANQINYDKDIGCIEARTEAALRFAACATSAVDFNFLMQQFGNQITQKDTDIEVSKKAYQYLDPYLGKLCSYEGKEQIIDLPLIQNYLADTFCISNFYTVDYESFIQEAAISKARMGFYVCFKTRLSAELHLSFIRNELGINFEESMKKASIRYTPKFKATPYRFRLLPDQFNALRDSYQNNFPKLKLQAPYCLKALRADWRCYTREFVELAIPNQDQKRKFYLRRGMRGVYEATPDGVYHRTEKKKKYSKEEKANYSMATSTTLVTENYSPPVFGSRTSLGKDRTQKLVGVILKDILINKMFLYDRGTFSRFWHFENFDKATDYFNQRAQGAGKLMFADIDEFKAAIEQPQNQRRYNEVLAHVRWTMEPDQSLVFIGSNTLEARLLAKDYARIILKRLKEQAEAEGLSWDSSYQIPICYYLPNSLLHMTTYDSSQQTQDEQTAEDIYSDESERKKKFSRNDFEFLLGLKNVEKFVAACKVDNVNILFYLMSTGHLHIAQSLMEKLDNQTLLNSIIRRETLTIKPLYYAARAGDAKLVQWLLDNQSPVSSLTYYPLHIACKMGQLEVVKALLRHKPDWSKMTNKKQKTPTQIAAKFGIWEIVNYLAQLSRTDWYDSYHYNAALGYTAKDNQLKSMMYLLSAGASVDQCEKNTFSLLSWAISYRNLPMVKYLLEKKASFVNLNSLHQTPLICAIANDLEDIVKLLLQNNAPLADKDKNDLTPIVFAATQKKWEMTKLIAAHIDKSKSTHNWNKPDEEDLCKALVIAVQENQPETIDALISGRNYLAYCSNFYEALTLSVKNKQWEIVLKLAAFECHYYYKRHYNRALRKAVLADQLEIAKLLLRSGASATYDDDIDQLPIIFSAINNNNKEMLLLLNQYGADLKQGDFYSTPIVFAAKQKKWELVKTIAARVKITINSIVNTDEEGLAQCLVLAVDENEIEIVKHLITGRDYLVYKDNFHLALAKAASQSKWEIVSLLANFSCRGWAQKQYNQALIYAVKADQFEIAQKLLKSGASANSTDEKYSSPAIFEAISNNNRELLSLLILYSADLKKDHLNNKPIVFAAKQKKWELVKFIAERISKVKKTDKLLNSDEENLGTCLILAVEANEIEIVKCLVADRHYLAYLDNFSEALTIATDRGMWEIVSILADLKYVYWNHACYNLALLRAVNADQLEIAQKLLKLGASANSTDDRSQPIIFNAITNNNQQMVLLLIQHGAYLKKKGLEDTPVLFAAKHEKWEIVKAIASRINKTRKINILVSLDEEELGKCLILAVQAKEIDVVENLISGRDYLFYEEPIHKALAIAARLKKWDIALILTDSKNLGTKKGLYQMHYNQALVYAVKAKQLEVAKKLLESAASPNAKQNDLAVIFCAIKSGSLEMVLLLLNHKADLSVKNTSYQTPIEFAAAEKKWDIVQQIVPKISNFRDKKDEEGLGEVLISVVREIDMTTAKIIITKRQYLAEKREFYQAVKIAVDQSNWEMATLLADLKVSYWYDSSYNNALLAAAMNDQVNFATKLLTNGAKPVATDDNGFTPIFHAIKNQNSELVQLLLADSPKEKKNKQGQTAYEYAVELGDSSIIKLLEPKFRPVQSSAPTRNYAGFFDSGRSHNYSSYSLSGSPYKYTG